MKELDKKYLDGRWLWKLFIQGGNPVSAVHYLGTQISNILLIVGKLQYLFGICQKGWTGNHSTGYHKGNQNSDLNNTVEIFKILEISYSSGYFHDSVTWMIEAWIWCSSIYTLLIILLENKNGISDCPVYWPFRNILGCLGKLYIICGVSGVTKPSVSLASALSSSHIDISQCDITEIKRYDIDYLYLHVWLILWDDKPAENK